MHHYPHHIGDYRGHTAHLTLIEDGAYRRMLDVYYMHEKPLPLDPAEVQRLVGARSKEEKNAVRVVLLEFFTKQDDGWHQSRADKEIATYQGKATTARKNGKGGGRPRKNKPRNNQSGFVSGSENNPEETDSIADGETQNEPSEKLTVNRKPLTNSEAIASVRAKEPSDGKPRPHRLPEDWRPSIAGRAYAEDRGLDPDITCKAFVHHFSEGNGRGKKRPGWDRSWEVWCDREAQWRRPQSVRPAPAGESAAFYRAATRVG